MFVVIVETPDDPNTVEYHGPFTTADGTGPGDMDAATWMAQHPRLIETMRAVEMFAP